MAPPLWQWALPLQVRHCPCKAVDAQNLPSPPLVWHSQGHQCHSKVRVAQVSLCLCWPWPTLDLHSCSSPLAVRDHSCHSLVQHTLDCCRPSQDWHVWDRSRLCMAQLGWVWRSWRWVLPALVCCCRFKAWPNSGSHCWCVLWRNLSPSCCCKALDASASHSQCLGLPASNPPSLLLAPPRRDPCCLSVVWRTLALHHPCSQKVPWAACCLHKPMLAWVRPSV